MHKSLSLLPLLALCFACGKSNSNAGLPKNWNAQIPIAMEEPPKKAYYMADLISLNAGTTGPLTGRVTVEKNDNKYKAKVKLSTSEWHQQNIYVGTRCPSATDDVNGDTVLDTTEAGNVVGKVIMPLSDNSSTTNVTGQFDLQGKVVLIESSTEALACGVLSSVPTLPEEPTYQPTPEPRPTPTPAPTPSEPPSEDDHEDGDWADRFNRWWRCRFGGC